MNALVRNPVGVPVVWRDKPFEGKVRRFTAIEGQTIADLVASIPDLSPWILAQGIVCINGIEVPREYWHRVRPRIRPGKEIVITLHAPLFGGGGGGGAGGGKNTFAMVASIAVLVAALAISGGALGVGFVGATGPGLLFGAGSTSASLLAGAVSVGGALAIAAFTPPPSFDAAPAPAAGGGALGSSGTGSASLTGNVLQPGGAVPRVVGTHRVYPPLACQPLGEIIGEEEYVEAVYVLAGPHTLEDPKVGSVSTDEIDEIEIELQEGLPDSVPVTLVERYGRTDNVSIEMSRHQVKPFGNDNLLVDQDTPDNSLPKWHTIVTRDSPDEVWITVNFPEGLFNEGDVDQDMNIPIRIRMRQIGFSPNTWINLPEIHYSNRKAQLIRKMIKLRWATCPSPRPEPPGTQGWVLAYTGVPNQVGPPVSGAWVADAHFDPGGSSLFHAGNYLVSGLGNIVLATDVADIYLGGATFPQARYEIQVIAGHGFPQQGLTYATYEYIGGTVRDFFGYVTESGDDKIQVPLAGVHHKINIERHASVYNTHPIATEEFAVMALRAHNRSVDRFSVLASGLVPDWDGSAWTGLVATSNPAPHFRDVLLGSLSANPLPQDLIDDEGLVEWRQHCIDQEYEVNAVCEGRSAIDVLNLIAGCGLARPRQSELVGVIVDRDTSAESVVQTFSPRTSRGYRFEKAFNRLPDGFRVRFDDYLQDYEEREIIVFAPWFSETASTLRLEDIRYDGVDNEEAARARALFDLGQMQSRMTFHHLEAPISAIICARGDLCGVTHDVLEPFAGFARIKSKTTLAGNITGLVLDGTVPTPTEDQWSDTAAMWSSYTSQWDEPAIGAAITLADGTRLVVEVTGAEEESSVLSLVSPVADPGSMLAEDNHVVTGRLGEETQRMKVFAMTAKKEKTFQITFVDEANALFNTFESAALLREDDGFLLREDDSLFLREPL